MPFMMPEYSNKPFAQVENAAGLWLCPQTEAEESLDEAHEQIVAYYRDDWFARLSAPGYLDCTEWAGPFDDLHAAMRHIEETYDVDPIDGRSLTEDTHE